MLLTSITIGGPFFLFWVSKGGSENFFFFFSLFYVLVSVSRSDSWRFTKPPSILNRSLLGFGNITTVDHCLLPFIYLLVLFFIVILVYRLL